MIIEIWADFACPFCYIGKKRLEEALSEFKYKDDVEIHYKSFLLNKDAPNETNLTALEQLSESKGITVDNARKMYRNVANMAKTVGLDYNIEKIVPTSTLRAHQLVKWAETKEKDNFVVEKLYEAYFVKGLNLASIDTLVSIAKSANLNSDQAIAAINNKTYLQTVLNDIEDAKKLGVRSVPTFIADRSVGISGAMKKERFLKFLEESYKKTQDIQIVSGLDSCGNNNCDF